MGQHKAAPKVKQLLRRDKTYSSVIEKLTLRVEDFNKSLLKAQEIAKNLMDKNEELSASKGQLQHEVAKLQDKLKQMELAMKGNPFLDNLVLPSGFRYVEYVLKYRELCSAKMITDLGWHALVRLPLLINPLTFTGASGALDIIASMIGTS